MKIVITGGHHSSALPLIPKLRKLYPNLEIVWFGHKHSVKGDKNITLEFKEITQLGIPFYNLTAGKLYKTYNIKRLIKIPLGIVHSFILLIKIKPDLIISFGGYLAAPTVLSGYLLGIPSITHEQTVTVGYANRFIGKFANKILVSWPQSAKFFPKNKVVITGLPLREEIYVSDEKLFNVNPDLKTIFVIGGKTGSHTLNLAVMEILDKLLQKYNVIHQCGDTSLFDDYSNLRSKYNDLENTPGNFELRKFVYANEIGTAFKLSSLVISRSGAHVSAELLALEKPCVLIPIPWVSHNEQYKNAQILEKSGIGVILEEKKLSGDSLSSMIEKVLQGDFLMKDKTFKEMLNPNASDLFIIEIGKYLKNEK